MLAALPAARLLGAAPAAAAGVPSLAGVPLADATLQAFADTLHPGPQGEPHRPRRPDPPARDRRRATPSRARCEADALRLYHDPLIGFDALAPAFLAELEARSLPRGGPFLDAVRTTSACSRAASTGSTSRNPTALVWEAAAAVPFAAFCAAGEQPNGTIETASGYQVMGYPGTAPNGYQPTSATAARSRASGPRTGSLP